MSRRAITSLGQSQKSKKEVVSSDRAGKLPATYLPVGWTARPCKMPGPRAPTQSTPKLCLGIEARPPLRSSPGPGATERALCQPAPLRFRSLILPLVLKAVAFGRYPYEQASRTSIELFSRMTRVLIEGGLMPAW
ncbi:MAG: hypothetical protein JWO52_7028 [Gammaproteobacteria bacterium]|nr:hypothetical protein [Gammaproteobacteria bacterium]